MTHRSYKFRIYPNKEQEIVLKKTIGCCRYVYNFFLKENNKRDSEEIFKYKTICKKLTELKKEKETCWLNNVSSVALQQSLRSLDTAFVNFFSKKSKYPHAKLKRHGGSAKFVGHSFRLKKEAFYAAKIKTPIEVVWSRKLPSEPSSCTISLNPSGQWFVSFVCQEEILNLFNSEKQIGIDLGIETFATFSDGTKIKQPDSIRKMRKKLAKAQKNQDRKKSGSKNHNKARVKVARICQKTVNIRTNFLQKLSTQLIRENQTIAIEDLLVEKMVKNRRLARLIGEQGWHSFRRMLQYKSEWYGRELVVIDRFFPSSKTCSCCGKQAVLTLKDRVWSCACGATHDRDVNAAKNILAAGMAVSACGVDVRPVLNGRLTMKQEVLTQ